MSSELLKCCVLARRRCAGGLDLRSPLPEKEGFHYFGSCNDCPPKSSALSICATATSSDVSSSPLLKSTAFSFPTTTRILYTHSNVMCKDLPSLVSCINYTYQHSDKRPCPITIPRFAYGWIVDHANVVIGFGVLNIPLPT